MYEKLYTSICSTAEWINNITHMLQSWTRTVSRNLKTPIRKVGIGDTRPNAVGTNESSSKSKSM